VSKKQQNKIIFKEIFFAWTLEFSSARNVFINWITTLLTSENNKETQPGTGQDP
jgi:hypothetical protein